MVRIPQPQCSRGQRENQVKTFNPFSFIEDLCHLLSILLYAFISNHYASLLYAHINNVIEVEAVIRIDLSQMP